MCYLVNMLICCTVARLHAKSTGNCFQYTALQRICSLVTNVNLHHWVDFQIVQLVLETLHRQQQSMLWKLEDRRGCTSPFLAAHPHPLETWRAFCRKGYFISATRAWCHTTASLWMWEKSCELLLTRLCASAGIWGVIDNFCRADIASLVSSL